MTNANNFVDGNVTDDEVTIDLTQFLPDTAVNDLVNPFECLPTGKYRMVLRSNTLKLTKDKTSTNWLFNWEVVEVISLAKPVEEQDLLIGRRATFVTSAKYLGVDRARLNNIMRNWFGVDNDTAKALSVKELYHALQTPDEDGQRMAEFDIVCKVTPPREKGQEPMTSNIYGKNFAADFITGASLDSAGTPEAAHVM